MVHSMINEIHIRFDHKTLPYGSTQLKSSSFFEIENILPLAEAYDFFDRTQLGMECTVTSHTLVNKELETITDVLLEMVPLKVPKLVKFPQFALAIVGSTAECERSFSTLKCVKSYLCSTMPEECLSYLAVSIERRLTDSLSFG